jgi:hypothetical protein
MPLRVLAFMLAVAIAGFALGRPEQVIPIGCFLLGWGVLVLRDRHGLLTSDRPRDLRALAALAAVLAGLYVLSLIVGAIRGA